MLAGKFLILTIGFILVQCQQPEDGADCNACKSQYRGVCNVGNSPTTCDDPGSGCYKFSWRNNAWTKYNYSPANCNECLKVRGGTACDERARTCTTHAGQLHWNCNKNEECVWAPNADPRACNAA
ncbi:hypothetical protein M8J76_008461 [Diaphorina citri]|nr:hypothetical protein M8J75_006411 [Diaphorina citri]KAI5722444.1 hypothetical protein M8J76_008461 [Diaphorina citri]KAI5724435.1 hypothetical protein M8J77_002609 [Diaphorina citri]